MLKLKVEYALTGPLSNPGTLRSLQDAVHEGCETLEDAAFKIRYIPGLACYRGGSHVAVHQNVGGGLGDIRLAIITRGETG